MKGRFWFMEADMKQTQTLRPDKTGKALLTVLRHLGRLHEVRPLWAQHSVCDPHILSIYQLVVLRGHRPCSGALTSIRSACSVQGSLIGVCNSHPESPIT